VLFQRRKSSFSSSQRCYFRRDLIGSFPGPKPTRHLAFLQNYYCAFTHHIFEIKLSRITWPCIAGSIVLVKILNLLHFDYWYQNDFCLILGVRCVAIGLYMMLEGHESCGVPFLKPDSIENFGHTTNMTMRLIFLHSKCCLPCIKAFSNATFCVRHGIFLSVWLHSSKKLGFFLRVFFFWRLICYTNSKTPKMLIYMYLTISMSSSIMCRSRNS